MSCAALAAAVKITGQWVHIKSWFEVIEAAVVDPSEGAFLTPNSILSIQFAIKFQSTRGLAFSFFPMTTSSTMMATSLVSMVKL